MKLEIGSGTRPTPGYLHADINPDLPELDYVCPMWAVPVPDGEFEEVRTVHVLEHAPRPMWLPTLKEWHRILAPGGVAHIDTPNLDRNVKLYVGGEWLADFYTLTAGEQAECSVEGKPNRTLWLNFKAFSSHHEYDLHFGNFTPELLTQYCLLAGFARAEVTQTEPSLIVRAWK